MGFDAAAGLETGLAGAAVEAAALALHIHKYAMQRSQMRITHSQEEMSTQGDCETTGGQGGSECAYCGLAGMFAGLWVWRGLGSALGGARMML